MISYIGFDYDHLKNIKETAVQVKDSILRLFKLDIFKEFVLVQKGKRLLCSIFIVDLFNNPIAQESEYLVYLL